MRWPSPSKIEVVAGAAGAALTADQVYKAVTASKRKDKKAIESHATKAVVGAAVTIGTIGLMRHHENRKERDGRSGRSSSKERRGRDRDRDRDRDYRETREIEWRYERDAREKELRDRERMLERERLLDREAAVRNAYRYRQFESVQHYGPPANYGPVGPYGQSYPQAPPPLYIEDHYRPDRPGSISVRSQSRSRARERDESVGRYYDVVDTHRDKSYYPPPMSAHPSHHDYASPPPTIRFDSPVDGRREDENRAPTGAPSECCHPTGPDSYASKPRSDRETRDRDRDRPSRHDYPEHSHGVYFSLPSPVDPASGLSYYGGDGGGDVGGGGGGNDVDGGAGYNYNQDYGYDTQSANRSRDRSRSRARSRSRRPTEAERMAGWIDQSVQPDYHQHRPDLTMPEPGGVPLQSDGTGQYQSYHPPFIPLQPSTADFDSVPVSGYHDPRIPAGDYRHQTASGPGLDYGHGMAGPEYGIDGVAPTVSYEPGAAHQGRNDEYYRRREQRRRDRRNSHYQPQSSVPTPPPSSGYNHDSFFPSRQPTQEYDDPYLSPAGGRDGRPGRSYKTRHQDEYGYDTEPDEHHSRGRRRDRGKSKSSKQKKERTKSLSRFGLDMIPTDMESVAKIGQALMESRIGGESGGGSGSKMSGALGMLNALSSSRRPSPDGSGRRSHGHGRGHGHGSSSGSSSWSGSGGYHDDDDDDDDRRRRRRRRSRGRKGRDSRDHHQDEPDEQEEAGGTSVPGLLMNAVQAFGEYRSKSRRG